MCIRDSAPSGTGNKKGNSSDISPTDSVGNENGMAPNAPSGSPGNKKGNGSEMSPMDSNGNEMQGPELCNICQEALGVTELGKLLPCNHSSFHVICILEWLGRDSTCPNCREDVVSCNGQPVERRRQPVADGYADLMQPEDVPDLSQPRSPVAPVVILPAPLPSALPSAGPALLPPGPLLIGPLPVPQPGAPLPPVPPSPLLPSPCLPKWFFCFLFSE